MFQFRNRRRQEADLYDASANFMQALDQSRRERGEPVSGLSRSAWEARSWLGNNSKTLIGIGVGIGILAFASFFLANSEKIDLRSRFRRAA